MYKIWESWEKCRSEVSLDNISSVYSCSCTRRKTMSFEWNATQNEGIHVHVESTRECLHTTKWQRKSNDVTRRKQRHSQSLCMLKRRDAQSVTSLMLFCDELGSARRALRNLKTGQHENTRENATGEMTVDERITEI